MHITLHGSSVCMRASFHLHVIHDERLIVRSLSVSSCLSFSCFSLLFTSSLPYPTCTLTCTLSSMSTAPRATTAAPSPNEEYCPLAIYHPPTGYEPNVFDDFHYSETRTRVMRNSTMRPSEKHYLHHCSFRSEKNQRTEDKLVTLMKRVLLSAQFSHTQDRRDPYTNLVRVKNENQVAKWKTKESGFSLKDKKSKFSLTLEPRFRSTNFKSILIEEVFRS